MCVWLQENHPHVPPLVFVKPTSSMAIKPSHHVDTNGKVYLPFLHEWSYVCELCEIPVMPLYDETKHETLLSFLYMYMKGFVRTLTGWAPTKIERRSDDVTKFNL